MKKKANHSTCPTCGQRIEESAIQLLVIRRQEQEIIKAIDIRVEGGEWISQVFVQSKKKGDGK